MSLHQHLKDATTEAHRNAESKDLQRQLVSGRLDEKTLVAFLGALHHVHACVEQQVDRNAAASDALAWSDAFRHSRRLEVDLESLGASIAAPGDATTRLIEKIESASHREPLALVGFFYVLEGSMNGNRFIVRAIRHSPIGERCDWTYFEPYGERQPAEWASFRDRLDTLSVADDARDAIVASALTMFDGIASICDELVGQLVPATG